MVSLPCHASNRSRGFIGITPGTIAIALMLVGPTQVGCQPSPQSASRETGSVSGKEGSGDSARSAESPTQVAETAIQLAVAQDPRSLLGLLAHEQIERDLKSLTRGRQKFASAVQQGSTLAAGSILATLSGYDPGSLRVAGESIEGNRATVQLEGSRDSKPATLLLYLVQERGTWKLVPSHRGGT